LQIRKPGLIACAAPVRANVRYDAFPCLSSGFWEREISSLFQQVDGFAGIGISDLVVESVLLNRKLILYNENKKGL
tara:strand:+ start:1340 stop:1567 length:228 start_codon:yes stop_codon:yes gene_type:complete